MVLQFYWPYRCKNKILSGGATSYRDGERVIEKYATPFKSPFPSKSGVAIAPPDHPVPILMLTTSKYANQYLTLIWSCAILSAECSCRLQVCTACGELTMQYSSYCKHQQSIRNQLAVCFSYYKLLWKS